MGVGHFLAIAIFVSYFLLIIGLLYLVLISVKLQATSYVASLKAPLVFGILTCVSLAHTWYRKNNYLLYDCMFF